MDRNNDINVGKETVSRKKVSFTKADAQSGMDLDTLSANGKTISEECQPRGEWLELFCPDDNCLLEEERIKLLKFCEDTGERHDHWLDVFCPDGSCEISEPSQLP
jgi:hypothetical protein